jgi:hypothetical protein
MMIKEKETPSILEQKTMIGRQGTKLATRQELIQMNSALVVEETRMAPHMG